MDGLTERRARTPDSHARKRRVRLPEDRAACYHHAPMETETGRAGGTEGARPTSPRLDVGDVVADKYQIEATLGIGGTGAVYAAQNLRTRTSWALKVLHPEMRGRADVLKRFFAEAKAAGRIGHPGIVEIVDQDRDGDLHFLVMPKLDGEELSTRITRAQPLSASFVARVGADVADAIAAAHRAKIIHRDLKPANIFLARKGGRPDVVQILDFGIAKLTEADGDAEPALTRTREIYGTPHYMSPEQLRSARTVDERTDVYAIGVILYEALAGRRPFHADSLTALALKIMNDDPPPLEERRPDVPAGLIAVVKRAMSRDREARFPTATALRDALRKYVQTSEETHDPLAATVEVPWPVRPARSDASTTRSAAATPTNIVTSTNGRSVVPWAVALAVAAGLAVAAWLLLI
jgi:serine/threonine protein kinase